MFTSAKKALIFASLLTCALSDQTPTYCIDLYRQDVLQWWTVENSSHLCYLTMPSTDPDKLGLQAINNQLYVTSKYDNESIANYWLTEKTDKKTQLSVYVYRKYQKAHIFLTLEMTDDFFKIGSNRFFTTGKPDSMNRTVFYVAEKDIRLRAGEHNYFINCVAFSIVIICSIVCSAVFKSPGLSTVFLCGYYFVNAVLQGFVAIAHASSLITVLSLTAVPMAFVATLHHRFGLRMPSYFIFAFLIIYFVFSAHFRFTLICTVGSILIGILGVLARTLLNPANKSLNDSITEKTRPLSPFIQVIIFNTSTLWISMSLLYYYPGELMLHFRSAWLTYAQFDRPGISSITVYCAALALALGVVVVAHTLKLDVDGDDNDTSYQAEDDKQTVEQ